MQFKPGNNTWNSISDLTMNELIYFCISFDMLRSTESVHSRTQI